jgi:Flp pilus assembly protein CpaB
MNAEENKIVAESLTMAMSAVLPPGQRFVIVFLATGIDVNHLAGITGNVAPNDVPVSLRRVADLIERDFILNN